MEQNEKINDLEKGLYAHEVQCDETGLTRIESRMLAMGGTVILFLAGVLVTLLSTQ